MIIYPTFLLLGTVVWKWPNKCRIYIFLSQKNTVPPHPPMLPNVCTGTSLRSWRGATLRLMRPISEQELTAWVSERPQWYKNPFNSYLGLICAVVFGLKKSLRWSGFTSEPDVCRFINAGRQGRQKLRIPLWLADVWVIGRVPHSLS